MRALGGVTDSLKEQLVTDYNTAGITEINKAILDYAVQLTKAPESITEKEVKALRLNHSKITDHTLHDIVQVVSYFNYVNRLADGLGVELEEGFKE